LLLNLPSQPALYTPINSELRDLEAMMSQVKPSRQSPSTTSDQKLAPDVSPDLTEPAASHPGRAHWEQMQAALQEAEQNYRLLQTTAELRQKLYRLYLLDTDSTIAAAEVFAAQDDTEAIEVAATVHEATSDIFVGYELWRHVERVVPDHHGSNGGLKRSFEDAVQLHQHMVTDLVERLQKTFACVNRSKKLVELTTKLHKR
jgi:hypothetical protein